MFIMWSKIWWSCVTFIKLSLISEKFVQELCFLSIVPINSTIVFERGFVKEDDKEEITCFRVDPRACFKTNKILILVWQQYCFGKDAFDSRFSSMALILI